jgi:histidine triad (HIT) family protein
MHNHEPVDYNCPFCRFLAGLEDELNAKSDIIYDTEDVMAVVAPRWWANNPGSVLIFPKKHAENLYNIPENLLVDVSLAAKTIAIAIRETYGCDGVSTRQHNEPAGGQDVWHFHMHIFPRYTNDRLYEGNAKNRFTSPEERAPYARKLREYLQVN